MNNLAQLHIDRTKCSGCGRCVQVCPGSLFFLDPSHHAAHHPIERFGWDGCWKCQHCLAVCPNGAIHILGKDPKDSLPAPPIETAETSCRSNMHWSTMSNRWTGCERSLLNGWTHWLPVGSIQMAMTQKAFRISSGPKRPYDRICCFAALPTC